MHYSPSEKDGVFVVEVSCGADNLSAVTPKKPVTCANPTAINDPKPIEDEQMVKQSLAQGGPMDSVTEKSKELSTVNEIQVHNPPSAVDLIESVQQASRDLPNLVAEIQSNGDLKHVTPNVGLSQSDLSSSSSDGSNQNYCYGNQEEFTAENIESPVIGKLSRSTDKINFKGDSNKPVIRSAIYKENSIDPLNEPLTVDGQPERLQSDDNALSKEKTPIPSPVILSNGHHNLNEKDVDDITAVEKTNGHQNGLDEKISTISNGIHHKTTIENTDGYDSLINLPAPPTTEEIKQLNELMDNNLDSLPPPPPPDVMHIEGQNIVGVES